jgi:hypothetical protein
MKKPRRPIAKATDQDSPQEAAAALAITVLSFIAEEPERLGRFLALTGIGPESIRSAASEPGFLLGVLDHLAGDEPLLIAFAEQHDVDPDDVERARFALAGKPPEPT